MESVSPVNALQLTCVAQLCYLKPINGIQDVLTSKKLLYQERDVGLVHGAQGTVLLQWGLIGSYN